MVYLEVREFRRVTPDRTRSRVRGWCLPLPAGVRADQSVKVGVVPLREVLILGPGGCEQLIRSEGWGDSFDGIADILRQFLLHPPEHFGIGGAGDRSGRRAGVPFLLDEALEAIPAQV